MLIKGFQYLSFFIIVVYLAGCSATGYKAYQTNNISLDSNYNSKELEVLISPYRDSVETIMDRVIGYAEEPLVKYAPESPLGNFAVDIVFWRGMKLHPSGFEKASIENTLGLINFGGLRAPINVGDITVGNIFELMPFDNTIVIVKLKGGVTNELMTYLREEGGQPVSNATFNLVGYNRMTVNGNDFDPEEDLYVITTNYLASGGDGMNFLKNADLKWDSGILVRDVFIEYIKTVKNIEKPAITGRIVLE